MAKATEKAKKPQVRRPPAEIVGIFGNVMQQGDPGDGRDLYQVVNGDREVFIRSASIHQALPLLSEAAGITITKVKKSAMTDLYRKEALRRAEEKAKVLDDVEALKARLAELEADAK